MKFDLSSVADRGIAMFKQFPSASIVTILIVVEIFWLLYLYSITKGGITVSFTMRETGFSVGRAGLGEKLADDSLAFVFGPPCSLPIRRRRTGSF